jgi:C_GCAxxG_C_C family probable redox protein
METLVMDKADQAVGRFQGGFNCAQAVLSAFAPGLGLAEDLAGRLATAFGGGMGCSGNVCGAISGALMVIGLRTGTSRAFDKEGKERAYQAARDFLQQFQARHGSLACRELIGCDIGTPEGVAYAKERDLFTTRCCEFVRTAAEILVGQLSEMD